MMRMDRQGLLALGELAFFLMAWMLGIFAALNDYREAAHPGAGHDVAATSGFSDVQEVLE